MGASRFKLLPTARERGGIVIRRISRADAGQEHEIRRRLPSVRFGGLSGVLLIGRVRAAAAAIALLGCAACGSNVGSGDSVPVRSTHIKPTCGSAASGRAAPEGSVSVSSPLITSARGSAASGRAAPEGSVAVSSTQITSARGSGALNGAGWPSSTSNGGDSIPPPLISGSPSPRGLGLIPLPVSPETRSPPSPSSTPSTTPSQTPTPATLPAAPPS